MRFKITILISVLCTGYCSADIVRVPGDFATIQTAIDSASVGDTVLVDPGTYMENIDFHGKQLVVGSLFLTSGDVSHIEQTIIDGNRDSSVVSIESGEPEGTEIVGFSIRNGLGTGDWPNVRGGGIHIGRPATASIRYCYIFDNESTGSSNRGAGIFANSATSRISNCRIYNNTSGTGAGITIGNGSFGVVIDSSEVYDNHGDGIVVGYSNNFTLSRTLIHNNDFRGFRSHETNNTKIIHCTIVDNGSSGIAQSTNNAPRDSMYIVNTIVYDNMEPLDIENDSTVFASYSLIAQGEGRLWFGAGCLQTAPLFEVGSYDPAFNSPTIDTGDPSSPLDPDGSRADIGSHFRFQETSTSVSLDDKAPRDFTLYDNYPNPFNPGTTIKYSLERSGIVELTVYDILGIQVRALVNESKTAGLHTTSWDGRGDNGQLLPTGLYFYRLRVAGSTLVRQMTLLK